MKGPRRIGPDAAARFGTRIDRAEPVGFRFDGRSLSGLYGDTLASALLANGVRHWSTSASRGRPRGPIALGLEDDVPLSLEDDAGAWAAITSDEITVREGMTAHGPGPGPGRAVPLHKMLAERIRRVLPIPAERLPAPSPPPRGRREVCDVAVIGAGLAGLAAAAAARAAGLDVRVIETSFRAGGAADLVKAEIAGLDAPEWAAREAASLRDRDALILGARATAIDPDGLVTAVERIDPRRPGQVALRLIHARAVVLATGWRERPLLFTDNDRPGVMLSTTARALLRRYAVAPGARVVIATACDDGYRTALDLRDAGVTVEMVLDARDDPQGSAVEIAKALGTPVSLATVVAGVEFSDREGLTGVRAQNRHGEGASLGLRTLAADALIVSGGFTPRDELVRRAGLTPEQGLFTAFSGVCASEAIAGGWAAGASAAAHLGAGVEGEAPVVEATVDDPQDDQLFGFDRLDDPGAQSAFIDFGADVTAADVADAVARGFDGPNALARRLNLGRDGGRLGADLPSLAFMAAGGAGALPAPSPGRPTLAMLAARSSLMRED